MVGTTTTVGGRFRSGHSVGRWQRRRVEFRRWRVLGFQGNKRAGGPFLSTLARLGGPVHCPLTTAHWLQTSNGACGSCGGPTSTTGVRARTGQFKDGGRGWGKRRRDWARAIIHGSLSCKFSRVEVGSPSRAIHCNLQPARPSARLRNLSTPSTLAQLLPTMACLREVDSQSVSPRLLVSGRLESGAPLLPRLKARDSQMEPRSRTGAPFRPATLPGDVIGGQSKPLSTVTPSSAQCSLLTASASLAQGAISALAVGHLSIRDGLTLQQSTSQHSQMLPLAPGELIGIMASPWSPASAQTRSSVRICLAVRSLRYIGRGTRGIMAMDGVHGRSRPACHNGSSLA